MDNHWPCLSVRLRPGCRGFMRLNGRENNNREGEYNSESEGSIRTLSPREKDYSTVRRIATEAGIEGPGSGRHGEAGPTSLTRETDEGTRMTHGEKLPRIGAKLSYLEREKPKWYHRDE